MTVFLLLILAVWVAPEIARRFMEWRAHRAALKALERLWQRPDKEAE